VQQARWWFLNIFVIFTPKIGEDFQFDEHILQMGWFNHQPARGFTRLPFGQIVAAISSQVFPKLVGLGSGVPPFQNALNYLPPCKSLKKTNGKITP